MGIHQQRGTGSNAVVAAYLAEGDAPFGAPFASSSTQSLTTQVTRVEVGTTNGITLSAIFDDIAVDTGSLPGPSAQGATPAVAWVAATAQPIVGQAPPQRRVLHAWGHAAAAPLQQTGVQTRTITYGYDGLNRLTSTQESGATSNSYSYSYDQVGNRTDGERQYDAANQVIGWSYDAAGNLLSNGTTTYTYDALNRAVTTGSTTNSSNADGILVQQGTTRYVQDLAAPLCQILSDGTSTSVYGSERLYTQLSGAKLWYAPTPSARCGKPSVTAARCWATWRTTCGARCSPVLSRPLASPANSSKGPMCTCARGADGSLYATVLFYRMLEHAEQRG